uniref:Testis cDNA clone: QtsA-10350, similar to human cylindromatosis (turban tumor syndrome) (CYLD) n=1 Tax=Macaca fascicularis TaxID=9541 RepID=Q4R4E7_MACFA|nr:unnamed protein product [Macaca fascicularis]
MEDSTECSFAVLRVLKVQFCCTSMISSQRACHRKGGLPNLPLCQEVLGTKVRPVIINQRRQDLPQTLEIETDLNYFIP